MSTLSPTGAFLLKAFLLFAAALIAARREILVAEIDK
jgi:hypothetical protein